MAQPQSQQVSTTVADLLRRIGELESENAGLKTLNKSLKSEIYMTDVDLEELQEHCIGYEAETEGLKNEIHYLKNELVHVLRTNDELESSIDMLESKMATMMITSTPTVGSKRRRTD